MKNLLLSNRQWVANRQGLFLTASAGLVIGMLIMANWDHPDRLQQYELAAIIIPALATNLWIGFSGLCRLDKAMCAIASMESERPIVMDPFDVNKP